MWRPNKEDTNQNTRRSETKKWKAMQSINERQSMLFKKNKID